MIRILIMLFFVTSCSSYLRTVGTRMISPETSAGFGNGTLDVRLHSAKLDHLDFSNDQTNNKIDNDGSVSSLSLLGEIGLIRRVDAFILPSMFLSPTLYGAKIQILGDERPNAKRGNFSVAVMGAFGSNSESFSKEDDLSDILFGNVNKLEVNNHHKEVGLIAGYRWHDRFLHYVNGIYLHETVDGKVTTRNSVLNNEKFKYNQDGMIYSTGFFWYFGSAHWKVDVSYFNSKWSKTRNHYLTSANTAIGFDW